METYNTSPPTDELARAQAELNQVKDIMVQNVEQILSRGERIELLVDKTDNMASQATAFRRGARTVRRQMWWKNSKILALTVVVVLVRVFSSTPPFIYPFHPPVPRLINDNINLLVPPLCQQVLIWIFAAQFCGAGLNQCGKNSS
jgi:vesicle-associated membrane protein 7